MSQIVVGVARLQGDRVLLQVGDDWHLVFSGPHASVIAKMLHDAAHGMPYAVDTITDLHTHGDVPPAQPPTPPLCDLHTDSDIPQGGIGNPA